MKIVFLETATLGDDIDVSYFDKLGKVTVYRESSPSENADRIKDADIIVVNKIPVNESLLKDADNVKLIAASATGTNNIIRIIICSHALRLILMNWQARHGE